MFCPCGRKWRINTYDFPFYFCFVLWIIMGNDIETSFHVVGTMMRLFVDIFNLIKAWLHNAVFCCSVTLLYVLDTAQQRLDTFGNDDIIQTGSIFFESKERRQYVWFEQHGFRCHSNCCRFTYTHISSFTGMDSRYFPYSLGHTHNAGQETVGLTPFVLERR